MKVLTISHTSINYQTGLVRYESLARLTGWPIQVIVPHRWNQYGHWLKPEPISTSGARRNVCRLFAPPMPTIARKGMACQWYLSFYERRLARQLADFQPDILDIWEEPWSLMAVQAAALCRKFAPRCRIVFETEQNCIRRLPPPFHWFQSFTMNQCDEAIARSKGAVDRLRHFGWQKAIHRIGNGVDTFHFQPSHPSNGKCDHPFTVGYVGRLAPEKGVDTLLHAISQLPNDINCTLIGNGPQEPSLRRTVDRLRLSDRVQFKGFLPFNALPTAYRQLDLLVMPSRETTTWREQFGRSGAEAMACGIPVIGTRTGSIPELLGEDGVLFPPDQPDDLAQHILSLRDDREKRKHLSAYGRSRVMQHYSWRQIAYQLAESFEDCLDFHSGNWIDPLA